jgi:exopolysaccharide biosynthesis polyprenyl glycosylphosphotransferase
MPTTEPFTLPQNDDDERPPVSVPPASMRPAYRLTGLRPSSVPPPRDERALGAVLDILMAAANADGRVCAREERAIRQIMTRLLGEECPAWVEQRMRSFEAATFSLDRAIQVLSEFRPEHRRHVVELVREVCDANNAYDIEEERYLLGVALALSLAREDATDLMIDAPEGVHGPVKRIFDVVFSSAALVATWPLLATIAVGVKATSDGPVLFKQKRLGRNNEEIEVWKFRTMTVTENGGDVRQATRNDARITRFGGFLRKTSLDELPQFYNVLRGDMSVVGPRPHAVSHNAHYRTRILEYMLRHKVKPGVTGWAQVNGFRGETDTLDKMIQRVSHDLEYIRRYSFWFDVQIVLRTVLGTGAWKNAY